LAVLKHKKPFWAALVPRGQLFSLIDKSFFNEMKIKKNIFKKRLTKMSS